jgi:hypothetical protein
MNLSSSVFGRALRRSDEFEDGGGDGGRMEYEKNLYIMYLWYKKHEKKKELDEREGGGAKGWGC